MSHLSQESQQLQRWEYVKDAEKRVCHVNEYADDGNRVNRFLNGDSGYSLQNDSEWRACCEEIELLLKGRSAKAVIRYLGKYR